MSKKRTTISIALVALLGLGFAILWLGQKASIGSADEAHVVVDDSVESASGENALPALEMGDAGGVDGEDLLDPPPAEQDRRILSESETRRIAQVVSAQEAFPHDVIMDEYKSELWADIQADPPALRPLNDPEVDADLAYRLYMYYGNCSVMPRTQPQIDSRLDRLAQRAEQANSRYLERIERNADRMIDSYEFCSVIPPEVDPRLEAIHWMARAVQLGHEIAQVQYYEKAMGFLLRSDRLSDTPPLVMLQSGLISEFKATARMALDMAMQNGHPEAYLAMSEAMLDGVIYPRDPVMSMAYLRAAQNQAMKNQVILRGLERQQYRVMQELDPEQVAQAEDLALDLQLNLGS